MADSWAVLLGRKLKELRRKAGLTQQEVGDRMGNSGASGANIVGRLERGAEPNPSVRTLTRFLRACGAQWYQIAGILDAYEFKPVDLRPIAAVPMSEPDAKRVKQKVEREVRKYELRQPTSFNQKPEHPARQARSADRFRRYRMVANLVEQGILELLRASDVTVLLYSWYRAAGRQLLGRLWRLSHTEQGRQEIVAAQPGLPERIARAVEAKQGEWERMGLDPELVAHVQAVVLVRFRVLLDSSPELFVEPPVGTSHAASER